MKNENYTYMSLFIHYEPSIEPEEPEKISDVYTVKDEKINNVLTNTTVAKFIQNLTVTQANVMRNGGLLENNQLVGTGDILKINQKELYSGCKGRSIRRWKNQYYGFNESKETCNWKFKLK